MGFEVNGKASWVQVIGQGYQVLRMSFAGEKRGGVIYDALRSADEAIKRVIRRYALVELEEGGKVVKLDFAKASEARPRREGYRCWDLAGISTAYLDWLVRRPGGERDFESWKYVIADMERGVKGWDGRGDVGDVMRGVIAEAIEADRARVGEGALVEESFEEHLMLGMFKRVLELELWARALDGKRGVDLKDVVDWMEGYAGALSEAGRNGGLSWDACALRSRAVSGVRATWRCLLWEVYGNVWALGEGEARDAMYSRVSAVESAVISAVAGVKGVSPDVVYYSEPRGEVVPWRILGEGVSDLGAALRDAAGVSSN